MRLLKSFILNDIKNFFRDWKAVVILVTVPVFFILVISYALGPLIAADSLVEPFTISVSDNEGTAQSRLLIAQISDLDIFRKIELTKTNEEAIKLVEANKAAAAVIIPEGLIDSVAHGENYAITVYGNPRMPLRANLVKSLMESAANMVSSGQAAINTVYHFNEKIGLDEQRLEESYETSLNSIMDFVIARRSVAVRSKSLPGIEASPLEYYLSSLITVFLMFGGLSTIKLLVRERNSGILRRLTASPVSPMYSVLSKFIITFIIGTMQFLAVIIPGILLLKNRTEVNIGYTLLMFASVMFGVSCWSLLISSVSKTTSAADITGSLGILLLAVLGGCIYPLTRMPETVKLLSQFTITGWAMKGFMELLSEPNAVNLLTYMAPIWILGIVMLALSYVSLKLRRGY
ncbi:MAG: ABC transporter permease [Eubacteriales bacterium]|nr:ABC transporter permease [Eubacteriales bacterium]